mgnify:CR=1 FL=1
MLALLVYAPALVFAAGWVIGERNGGVWAGFGLIVSLLSLATVSATGMSSRYSSWRAGEPANARPLRERTL